MPFAQINGTTLHYQVKGEGCTDTVHSSTTTDWSKFQLSGCPAFRCLQAHHLRYKGSWTFVGKLWPSDYLSTYRQGYETSDGSSVY